MLLTRLLIGIKSPKIYLAIKDTVFDVSSNKDSYGPNGGYHVFAGKDATRALAKSSLEEEDCIGDYVDLPASDIETLNDWFEYFKLRYSIMGTLNTATGDNSFATAKQNGGF